MAKYTKQECKSRFHHDWSIEDSVLHYFGCLKFKDRKLFFDTLEEKDKLKRAIIEEESRIRRLRNIFEKEGPTTPNGKLLSSFKIALSHRFPTIGRRAPPPPAARLQSPAIDPPDAAEEPKVEMLDIDDLNANVIYFKDNRPYDHLDFEGTFPNQKIPLSRLLENKQNNPLMWDCEENMIRYFHVPANNMSWIEEVIARYNKEPKKPDLDGPYLKPKRGDPESKTRMLLRPQFWRGLQHGNRKDLPTHTRHMRPRCAVISTDHRRTEPRPRNIALFMPYLHWETDRRRVRAADVVKKKTNAKWSAFDDVVDATARTTIDGTIDRVTSDGLLQQISTRTVVQSRRKSVPCIITNRSVQGQTLLGRVLLLAAALYEAMDAYTDEKLIEKYLIATPPLHPRRTLDQSYYWTLKDTRKRDRDQVVYRGTAPNPKLMHHKCFKTEEQIKSKTCCSQCLEDVTKVPRVVMVDQLWMWVLDGNTIITSFPKRWGRNKPDPSAAQKCIRTRLRAARDDEVRSVYDLALIIIDQCSRVFHDRAQSVDLQPQVMDSFANAIGRVSHKQTIAFDHFWEYTKITSKRYNAQEEGEPETRSVQKMQKTLLDINPEGDLLREIKDIMDELFIMTQIKIQEENVARSFVKHVKHILQPGSLSNGDNSLRNRSDVSLPEMRKKTPSVTIDQHHRPSLSASLSSPTITSPIDPFEHTGLEDYEWTMSCAADLLDSIGNQLLELGYLKEAAENTSAALKDLLELKQQQAGVVEAREAVKQGEESLRQGRSIMLFTIVTITFLPLSFFTGIFGMNATELTGATGDYKFKNIFVYMIPISFVVITCSLFLAFSKLVRALLSFGFNYAWAWLITRTSAYVRWHDTHMNSKTLKEREKTLINDMKVKALRDELARKIKEQERIEALLVKQEQARDPTSVLGQVDRARRRKRANNGAIELGSRGPGAVSGGPS